MIISDITAYYNYYSIKIGSFRPNLSIVTYKQLEDQIHWTSTILSGFTFKEGIIKDGRPIIKDIYYEKR